MSISIGEHTFDGPYTSETSLENASGVYVVLCAEDPLRVIDVGESEDIRDRVERHDRRDCWKRNCSGTLKYAAFYCDESTRMDIEQQLRLQYNPPCGEE